MGIAIEYKPVLGLRRVMTFSWTWALLVSGTLMMAQQAPTQEVLTNDSVVKMVKAGLGESLIVDMIRTKPGKYSTTTDDVVKLKQEGVSENEIAAMVARGSTESPTAPPASQPAPESSSSNTSSEPPCPAKYGAYYFDGSAWKEMSQVASGDIAGKARPFGAKAVARFRDAAAPIAVGESPKFCLYGGTQFSRNIVIAAVDVKGDHREIQMAHAGLTGSTSGIPDKKLQPIEVKQVSDYAVELWPKSPLAPGQYMIFPMGRGAIGYDFGVKAAGGF